MEYLSSSLRATRAAPAPKRPSWIRATRVTLSGLIFGWVVLFVLTLLATALHVAPTYGHGGGLHGIAWPWAAVDPWATLADVGWAAALCLTLAYGLRASVRAYLEGWALRFWPTAIALAIGFTGREDRATPIAFALLVVVLRNVALVPQPLPRVRAARPRQLGLAALVALLTAAALSYQPLHPLVAVPGRSHAAPGLWSGVFTNDGSSTITVRSATIAGFPHSLASLEFDGKRALAPGEETRVIARVRRDACAAGFISSSVGSVVVRYDVLGFTRTQRYPIEPPAQLACH